MKTGRRKLGRIYAQPIEKREELVFRFFFSFFFPEKNFFALLSSTLMRVVFTPVDFDVK